MIISTLKKIVPFPLVAERAKVSECRAHYILASRKRSTLEGQHCAARAWWNGVHGTRAGRRGTWRKQSSEGRTRFSPNVTTWTRRTRESRRDQPNLWKIGRNGGDTARWTPAPDSRSWTRLQIRVYPAATQIKLYSLYNTLIIITVVYCTLQCTYCCEVLL